MPPRHGRNREPGDHCRAAQSALLRRSAASSSTCGSTSNGYCGMPKLESALCVRMEILHGDWRRPSHGQGNTPQQVLLGSHFCWQRHRFGHACAVRSTKSRPVLGADPDDDTKREHPQRVGASVLQQRFPERSVSASSAVSRKPQSRQATRVSIRSCAHGTAGRIGRHACTGARRHDDGDNRGGAVAASGTRAALAGMASTVSGAPQCQMTPWRMNP